MENNLVRMLTVKDVKEHLHLGINATYKIFNMKGFPKIQIGQKSLVPEDRYLKWIDENIKNKILL